MENANPIPFQKNVEKIFPKKAANLVQSLKQIGDATKTYKTGT